MLMFRRMLMTSLNGTNKPDLEANFTLKFGLVDYGTSQEYRPIFKSGNPSGMDGYGIGFSFSEQTYNNGIQTISKTDIPSLKEMVVTITERSSGKIVYNKIFTSVPNKIVIGYGGYDQDLPNNCTDYVVLQESLYDVDIKVFLFKNDSVNNLVIADYLYTYSSQGGGSGKTTTESSYLECYYATNYISNNVNIKLTEGNY